MSWQLICSNSYVSKFLQYNYFLRDNSFKDGLDMYNIFQIT